VLTAAAVISLVRRSPPPAPQTTTAAAPRTAPAPTLARPNATPLALARPLPLPVAPLPAAPALARGLAGYWRFDDPRGSQVVRDRSPAGHDCQLHSPDPDGAWIKGAFGGGLHFGIGTWLECPLPSQNVGRLELTISAWTKRSKVRTLHDAIIGRQLGNEKKHVFRLALVGDQLEFRSDLAHGSERGLIVDPRDRWVHVAVSLRRDGRARMFVDGALVAEQRFRRVSASTVDKPLTIGAGIAGNEPAQAFHGELDELLLYDRALADEEIAALAHGAQPL